MRNKKDFGNNLLFVIVPMMMFFLLGPVDIWASNTEDFQFNWGDFFWINLLEFAVVTLVLTIVITAIPKKLSDIVKLLLSIGTMCAYIQAMFLNVILASEDGGHVKWDSLGKLYLINSLIWIVVIAANIVFWCIKKDLYSTVSKYAVMFLGAIQFVALVSLLITHLSQAGFVKEMYWFNGENQFKVAKNNNIILIVLDSFGSTQLDIAVENGYDVLDGMEDFTYYDNADSVYYRTFPSATHFLTGVEYDTQMPYKVWLDNAWDRDSTWNYYNTLHDNGYTCYLYSECMDYEYNNGTNLIGKFDNIKKDGAKVTKRKYVLRKMLKLSCYRYAPYIVKARFEVLTSEFSSMIEFEGTNASQTQMVDFRKALKENGVQIGLESDNAFIVQHLDGTHVPLRIDEYGNEVHEEETNISKEVQGIMLIVKEYLDYLKAIDKYDDSTIIITADHGQWEIEGRPDVQIIYFMKDAGEKHDSMQISSAPIHLCDLLPTIYEAAGLDYSAYGTSVHDWKENDQRERTVYNLYEGDFKGYIYNTKEELNEKSKKEPDIHIQAVVR